jgi:hypothetical protein
LEKFFLIHILFERKILVTMRKESNREGGKKWFGQWTELARASIAA